MAMDFGSIIKRSWQITWRHKALWVLGIFAGISGCQSGGGGGGGSSWRQGDVPGGFDGSAPDLRGFLDTVQQWLPALIAAGALLVLVGLVWWVLGIAARGGLIVGVNSIEQEGRPGVGALWSAGFSRFWSLLGLEVLLRLPIVAVMLAVMAGVLLPLFGSLAGGGQPGAEVIAPICGSLAVGIPVMLVLSFVLGIMELIAKRYVMLGGQGTFEAAGNSWRFFRARFKDTFLMWLINGALNIAASLVLIVPGLVIGVVVAVPVIMAVASGSWGALVPVVGIAFVLIMLLSFAYSAIWGTFTSALWTIFFRKVTGMEAPSITPVTVPAASAEAPYGQSPVAPQYAPPPEAPGYSPGPPMASPEPPAPPASGYPQYPPQPPAPGA